MARYYSPRDFSILPDVVKATCQEVLEGDPFLHACGHAPADEKWELYRGGYSAEFYAERGKIAELLRFFNDVFTHKACGRECEDLLIKAEKKAKTAARKAKIAAGTTPDFKVVKTAIEKNPYHNLPTIIDVYDTDDHGDFGAVLCPHCGAKGRYIKNFLCDDGNLWGAMAGCFTRFPQHPVVKKIDYYQDKWKDYEKRGWKLSRFDQQIFDALQEMRAGTITADALLNVMNQVARQREAWNERRGR